MIKLHRIHNGRQELVAVPQKRVAIVEDAQIMQDGDERPEMADRINAFVGIELSGRILRVSVVETVTEIQEKVNGASS